MVRRVRELIEEPPTVPLNNDETKCVCVIEAKVGQQEVAVLCDTGAGKSLIREDVANFFITSDLTKNHCSALTPLPKPLNCEGAEKGRVIGTITWYLLVRFSFDDVEAEESNEAAVVFSPALKDLRLKGRNEPSFVAKCYVMKNLSDPVILGVPELGALGVYLEPPDDHGRKWIQFTTKGLRLPLLSPQRRNSPMVTELRRLVSGPEFVQVPVSLQLDDYEFAVE